MVSVFGWPDRNTRENCECLEKHVKHEPNWKAGDFARFSQFEVCRKANQLKIDQQWSQWTVKTLLGEFTTKFFFFQV